MQQLTQLMTKAITVAKFTTIAQAVELMETNQISLVVVTDDSQPIGIFSLGDAARKTLRQKMDPEETLLVDHMTAPPRLATGDMTIREIIEIMTTDQIHHIPLVNSDGVLEGMISLSALLRDLLEKSETSNLALSNYIGADSMGG